MAITPYLLYNDVGAALRFLSRAFGFRRFGAVMRDRKGKINHATMKLGKAVVMMGCPGAGYRNPKRLGQATLLLYVDIKGVDKHCERARRAGAKIIEEPKNTPYGAADPEGHQWYFAQALRRPAKR
jgi:uncharacterized glyoxalase superfamily protein PhnB